MTWDVEDFADHRANPNFLIFFKQVVKLRSVQLEFRLKVENAFEHFLHRSDVVSNGSFSAQLSL